MSRLKPVVTQVSGFAADPSFCPGVGCAINLRPTSRRSLTPYKLLPSRLGSGRRRQHTRRHGILVTEGQDRRDDRGPACARLALLEHTAGRQVGQRVRSAALDDAVGERAYRDTFPLRLLILGTCRRGITGSNG